jgi:hypothetical protein
MIVELQKDQHLPVQRSITTYWNDYALVDDVVMLEQQDAAACRNLSSASGGLYVGPEETGSRGPRRLAIFMPDSLDAEIIDPTGTTISDYCVCSVEYTVDRTAGLDILSGRQAMPGQLPPTSPTSAYTYASNLQLREDDGAGGCTDTPINSPIFRQPSTTCSVDTDCAADGSRSCLDGRCTSPVFAYVKDFLGFDVGTTVPSGFYNESVSAWEGERDGRAVEVVSTGGGGCGFDVTGDGLADTSIDGLSAHDVGSDETLAFSTECGPGLAFEVGDVVWRIPLTHFSAHDWNWAADFVENALIPFIDWATSGPTNSSCCVARPRPRLVARGLTVRARV